MEHFDLRETALTAPLTTVSPKPLLDVPKPSRRLDPVIVGLIGTTWIATFAIFVVGIWSMGIAIASAASGLIILRKRAKSAPAAASTRLDEVIDVMSQGLMVLDSNGRIETANARLRAILGWPEGWDPVGQLFSEFITASRARGDYGPREVVPLQFLRDMTDASMREQVYHETPDGRSVSVATKPRFNGGWVLTFTDFTRSKADSRSLVTARAEADAQANRAQAFADEAAAANREKSAFLAKMSHEIRTPMNGIIGLSDVLDDGTLTADQTLSVNTIRNSAEALVMLINDILDLSKIEAGRLDLINGPFDLTHLTDEVLRLSGPLATGKGLILEVDYAPNLPRTFEGDALRLRQILTNLVGNAVKFTDQGRVRVEVSGQPKGKATALDIAVIDTGIGIPANRIATIFDDFVQVGMSEQDRGHGTGLGLAISARLVRKMGGEITVESKPEQGSRFTISLRLKPATERLESSMSSAPHAAAIRPLKILLAEDNRVNRMVFSKYLEPTEHQLTEVVNGQESVEAYGHARPDVLLMDLSMPVLDGWEATRQIRELERQNDWPAIPIIALTAHAMEDSREKCLAAGMTDYLAKPVRKEDLLAMLARHSGG